MQMNPILLTAIFLGASFNSFANQSQLVPQELSRFEGIPGELTAIQSDAEHFYLGTIAGLAIYTVKTEKLFTLQRIN